MTLQWVDLQLHLLSAGEWPLPLSPDSPLPLPPPLPSLHRELCRMGRAKERAEIKRTVTILNKVTEMRRQELENKQASVSPPSSTS